ncbi:Tetraspanin-9, partial [Taenia solium]
IAIEMNCLLGCVRLILAFLNLLLFIAFAVVGVIGLLLKYNSKFLFGLLEKATAKWPQKEMQDVVQFIQSNGSGLAIGFIVLGFAVAIIALIGLFALFCKNRFLGFIYIALLAVLSIIELGLIIYLFAIPGNLDKAAYKVLNSSFEHLRTNDSLTEPAYALWTVLGLDGGEFCCGLKGFGDFDGLLPSLQYPPPCCKVNITTASSAQPPKTCDQNEAKKESVGGCSEKVEDFLAKYKSLFIGISCGVLVFQFVVLLVMCALYKKWKSD